MEVSVHVPEVGECAVVELAEDETVAGLRKKLLQAVSGVACSCPFYRVDMKVRGGARLDGEHTSVRELGITHGDVIDIHRERYADIPAPCEYPLRDETAFLSALAISPSGHQLFAASRERATGRGVINVWDAESVEMLGTFSGHTGHITGLAVSPSGAQLYSSSADATVRVWCTTSRECLAVLEGHNCPVQGIAVSSVRDVVYTNGSTDRTLRVWCTRELRCVRTHEVGWTAKGVAESPCGAYLYVSSFSSVQVLRAESLSVEGVMRGHSSVIYALCVAKDGRVITCANDDTIRVWDPHARLCLKVLSGHTRQPNALAVSPCGKFLYSGGEDVALHVWDIGSYERVGALGSFDSGVVALVASPCGKAVFACKRQKGAARASLRALRVADALPTASRRIAR